MKLRNKWCWPLLAAALILIDQLTKLLARHALEGSDVCVITNILRLTLTYNTGAAFSFMDGKPYVTAVAGAAMVLILTVLLIKLKLTAVQRAALTVMTAGGVSNLIDRVFIGAVTDMIYIEAINFPVFNFADICVTLGALCFAILIIRESDKSKGSEPKRG